MIFESGWDLTPKDVSKPLLEPDPRCVIRKTYELQCQREFQEQESMVGVTSDTKEEIDKRYRLRIPKLAI